MSEDFTTRLRLQLRDAALREERRGPLARRLVAARPRPSMALAPFVAATAVGLVLAVSLWMLVSLRGEPDTAAAPGPRVVADIAVGEALGGEAATGFGAVWISDSGRGEIVRVDARTRRVTARIRVGAEASVRVAAGSVWAIESPAPTFGSGELMRIDPRSNRIVARIPLRAPGGGPFEGGLILFASHVWVLGRNGAVAVDPARNRTVAKIRYSAGGFQVVGAIVRDGELWLTRSDGSTTRFDADTGRRLGRLRWRSSGFLVPFADKLIVVDSRSATLVDPDTGRALWRTPVSREIHLTEVARGRLFVEGADARGGPDRVWQLDARTGRVTGSVAMPQFTPVGIVAVGNDVWLPVAGGRAVVVGP